MKTNIFIISICFSILFATQSKAQSVFESPFTEARLVKFFPNPATTFVQFDFSDKIDLSGMNFKIYNFIGKKVFESNQLTSRTIVNLNDFFRGVYIFQLSDRNGKMIESSKFQVQK